VRFALLLPVARFHRSTDQSFRTRRSLSPVGTGCSRRPFARRQQLPLSQVLLPGQRSWPGASLPGKLVPLPVRLFDSATRRRFAPVTGRINAPSPLQLSLLARFTASPAFTPHRDFYLPPDQSVAWNLRLSARLPNSPDLRSLPPAVSIK